MEEAHAAALDKLKEEAATALAATEAGHATLAEAAEAELDSLRAAFAAERALAEARAQKQSSDRRKEAAAHARGVRSALAEELAAAQRAHAADVGRLQEELHAATTAHAADVGGVVVDPVVCAASGDVFVDDATIEAIKAELLPLATVITPNAAEAQLLGGEAVEGTLSVDRARALAARLLEHGPRAVVVKGARLGEDEAPSMAWIGPPRAPGDDVIVDVCAFADGAVATLACPARCETRPPRPVSYTHLTLPTKA